MCETRRRGKRRITMKFGEKLKALRTDKGISQKALSDQTGISLRAIQNYETKDILPKSRDSYDALARALDVEVSTLLDENVAFQVEARERYGSRGERQARAILDQVGALYAGGELSEEDMDAFNRALQEAYWDAKAVNQKFTPKKYRKNPQETSD
jgi:transcriptional regulator with XRE-family HTH domain